MLDALPRGKFLGVDEDGDDHGSADESKYEVDKKKNNERLIFKQGGYEGNL